MTHLKRSWRSPNFTVAFACYPRLICFDPHQSAAIRQAQKHAILEGFCEGKFAFANARNRTYQAQAGKTQMPQFQQWQESAGAGIVGSFYPILLDNKQQKM